VSAGHAVRGLPYRITAAGRPTLPLVPAPDFSLAHTDGLALIAVGAIGPVGIDVERSRPVKLGADRITRLIDVGAALAGAGKDAASAPVDAAVIRAWTRLEAFGKALGTGIGPLLSDYDIAGRSAGPRATSGDRARRALEQSGLIIRDLDVGQPGVCAAIAAPAALLSSHCLSDIGDVEQLLGRVEQPA
jgi:phosphopantetheinyl transferase